MTTQTEEVKKPPPPSKRTSRPTMLCDILGKKPSSACADDNAEIAGAIVLPHGAEVKGCKGCLTAHDKAAAANA